jgi:hypothetical protein
MTGFCQRIEHVEEAGHCLIASVFLDHVHDIKHASDPIMTAAFFVDVTHLPSLVDLSTSDRVFISSTRNHLPFSRYLHKQPAQHLQPKRCPPYNAGTTPFARNPCIPLL